MNKWHYLFSFSSAAVFAAALAAAPAFAAANPQTSPAYAQTSATQMNAVNHYNDNNGQQSSGQHKAMQHSDVQAAIAKFKQEAPNIQDYFDHAYGYAVYPSVGKGGFVLGGAYGSGEVYKQGELVGYSTITKFDIGAQIGGQAFSEIIFFQDQQTFDHFTEGHYQFAANLTAVGVKSGGIATNDYSNGVAVFARTKGGLMAGASIGGQKFSFTPLSQAGSAATSN
ncbi:MAG TPA: lipid-binding SYLF domain-containing protein [Gammaproteobacteria bacterium]|nr:lipid-binding SYLF domain-containing protein [Gammaproteobacteria bacterium]